MKPSNTSAGPGRHLLAGGMEREARPALWHGLSRRGLTVEQRPMNFFGRGTLVSTSHERAHIMSSVALAPRDEQPYVPPWFGRACWESSTSWTPRREHREVEVLEWPGPDGRCFRPRRPSLSRCGSFSTDTIAGKLMALAAFGDPDEADPMSRRCRPGAHKVRPRWPAAKCRFRGLTDIQRRASKPTLQRTRPRCSARRSSRCSPRPHWRICPRTSRCTSQAAAG